MSRTFILLFLIFLCSPICSIAQSSPNNAYNAILFNVSYGFHLPNADLSDRFGSNFSIGGSIEYLTEKGNWMLGIKGNNLFGQNVKEDVLASIRSSDGFLIGNSGAGAGRFALVVLRERGFYVGGLIGKLFSLSKKNKRAGIRATIGAGLLQHKVRIQDESGTAQQIAGDYKKGYDQLSNGLALEQFIGYQYLSTNRGTNFFAGFEFTQAFTQNRRNRNFATRTTDNTKRIDVLTGFRIGWTIPIYVGEKGEDLFY